MRWRCLSLGLLLLGSGAEAEVLRGRVVGVVDGDTIQVLDGDKRVHRIRLQGIDAPERKQPFSRNSTERLASRVHGREVEVHWEKVDPWKRLVGKVLAPSPSCREASCPFVVDAGLELVGEGLAWWYRRYAKEQPPEDRERYRVAEERAKEGRLGLWSDPSPTPPWKWRKKGRSVRPAPSAGSGGDPAPSQRHPRSPPSR